MLRLLQYIIRFRFVMHVYYGSGACHAMFVWIANMIMVLVVAVNVYACYV